MSFNRLKPFTELLDPHTRLEMLKAGMISEIHSQCGSFDNFVKSAQINELFQAVGGTGKLIAALAVLAGVPMGIGLHKADYATSPARISERESKDRIKFYKGLTSNIESELAKGEDDAESINV